MVKKSPLGAATLSQWLFGLMFSLPFLLPFHSLPLPSFHSEWLAMLLALLGCIPLLFTGSLELPRIALAPLALTLVVGLQWLLGMFAYGATALMLALFLIWCALLAMAGRTLAARLDLSAFSDAGGDNARFYSTLAWFLFVGGMLNAFAGLLQYGQMWRAFGGWISEPMSLSEFGIYGNLAQQNHFATHLALALASSTYLCLSRQLARGWFAASALVLLLALVLSGSRSSFLYLLWIVALVLWLRRSDNASRLLRRAGWLALALVIAMLILAWLALHYGKQVPQLQRLLTLAGAIGVRGFLWQHALAMFFSKPLLGVGMDAFAWQLVEQLQDAHELNQWGIDQYAHNLPLQLLAGAGLSGFVVVAWPAWRFVQRQLTLPTSLPRMWFAAVCGILLIHSMLEQPLFFAYFLGIFAFLLGSAERDAWHGALHSGRRAGAGLLLVVALGVLLKTGFDYDLIDGYLYSGRYGNGNSEQVIDERHQAILDLHRTSLFAPLLELAAPADFVPDNAPVKDKLAFNLRLLHYAPIAEAEFRQAVLLTADGRLPEARVQLQRAVYAYPAEGEAYLPRFNALAQNDPATYAELAHYANLLFGQLLNKPK